MGWLTTHLCQVVCCLLCIYLSNDLLVCRRFVVVVVVVVAVFSLPIFPADPTVARSVKVEVNEQREMDCVLLLGWLGGDVEQKGHCISERVLISRLNFNETTRKR